LDVFAPVSGAANLAAVALEMSKPLLIVTCELVLEEPVLDEDVVTGNTVPEPATPVC
jgi:hypothetical protein